MRTVIATYTQNWVKRTTYNMFLLRYLSKLIKIIEVAKERLNGPD